MPSMNQHTTADTHITRRSSDSRNSNAPTLVVLPESRCLAADEIESAVSPSWLLGRSRLLLLWLSGLLLLLLLLRRRANTTAGLCRLPVLLCRRRRCCRCRCRDLLLLLLLLLRLGLLLLLLLLLVLLLLPLMRNRRLRIRRLGRLGRLSTRLR